MAKKEGFELSLYPASVAPDLSGGLPSGELRLLQKDIQTRFPDLHPSLKRNPWAYPLLDRLSFMPKDLDSSLRVGEIARRVLSGYEDRHPEIAIPQQTRDGIVLGSLLSDIGRADDDPEKMHEVYSAGIRWRDDPNAWQWTYVQAHPGRSSDLVVVAGRGTDSLEALIPRYHHGLKWKYPYTAVGAAPIETLPPEVQFGIYVAAAADVADAVTRNVKGEGRAYLDDDEFAGRDWVSVVTDEIAVDHEIAELAVLSTLQVKGVIDQSRVVFSHSA